MKRHWLGGVIVGVVTAGVAFAGCGGSTDDTAADAGAGDGSTTTEGDGAVTRDAAPDRHISDAAVTCEADADLFNTNIPDAAIGDGGGNAATCAACARSDCLPELTACNAECECRKVFVDFYACIGGGGSLLTCGSQAASAGGGQAGQPLALCVVAQCRSECGLNTGDGGGDGSVPGDGGGD